MTQARKEQLRQIMLVAHNWRRQTGCSMAEALRTSWRSAKMRNAPRAVLQTVKPGARGVSPLRDTAFLARRFDRRHSGFRYAAETRC